MRILVFVPGVEVPAGICVVVGQFCRAAEVDGLAVVGHAFVPGGAVDSGFVGGQVEEFARVHAQVEMGFSARRFG